jgi:hypothetical protein
MITMTATMNSNRALARAAAIFLLAVSGCDKQKDEAPAQAVLPEPTPPPVASAAPSPVPTPTPEPVVPPRVGLAKEVPPGVIEGGWEAGGKCNVEAVDATVFRAQPATLKGGAHALLAGWALDPKGTTAPDAVSFRFSSPKAGQFYGVASRRFVREDVNKSNPVEAKATAESGFEFAFDTDQLPEGTYSVTTVMQVGDKFYICDNGRKVTRLP